MKNNWHCPAFAAVLLFGDIGFDKPGRLGLDADSGLLILVLYSGALLLGLAMAARHRKPAWAVVQLLPSFMFAAWLSLPAAHYDASKYRHLVGMSRQELRRTIGSARGAVTGWQGGSGTETEEFVSLRGMVIYISASGIVTRVEASSR